MGLRLLVGDLRLLRDIMISRYEDISLSSHNGGRSRVFVLLHPGGK